jgi:hypothetical protein
MPAKPEELGDEQLNAGGGVLFVGSKGKMLQDTYGLNPRLLPASLQEGYGSPKAVLPRIPHEDHHMNWIDAIRGKEPASSPFDYATQLTEVMLLGIVSLRAKTKLQYDAQTVRVTNNQAANDFLGRDPRKGFELR